MSDSKHVTYEDAGVDTAEGGRAVDAIKQMVNCIWVINNKCSYKNPRNN